MKQTSKVGVGLNPGQVKVEVGEKVGVTVFIPTGAKLEKIDTPDCIEGWPIELIVAQRWGTVNGVKPGVGEIVFTLDDGAVSKLPVLVTEKTPTPNADGKGGKFVLDLYLPNGAHLRGEAELTPVE